ncbi:hypothetical protein L2Y96_12990 [Luteibacter aegosomaticola]|uniref:DUF6602 domain-containing protein n=1 Tax=Luteibacter aegosomaticola TaxID=2911538 RepID=UPI001FFC0BA4|nr:DUF6602 domain-containing protein [Luteibacter aegosomaticola]UPG88336.1 hypothetical protein L2Y96_12990 [Luteibacter aegosomaticola]
MQRLAGLSVKAHTVDIKKYFRDLTHESQALKNRVRNLMTTPHWLSDGEWKESVIRSMIRRIIGHDIAVGRGFVVSDNMASSQVDVLLYDASHPVLHRDGDFVFIMPAACRGIIEVKTQLGYAQFASAIERLADDAMQIRHAGGMKLDFVGLFAFDPNERADEGRRALSALARVAGGEWERVVDHVVLGPSTFLRFWDRDEGDVPGQHWSLYELDRMSPGYFLHNLVLRLSATPAEGHEVWFPREGKLAHRIAVRRL